MQKAIKAMKAMKATKAMKAKKDDAAIDQDGPLKNPRVSGPTKEADPRVELTAIAGSGKRVHVYTTTYRGLYAKCQQLFDIKKVFGCQHILTSKSILTS